MKVLGWYGKYILHMGKMAELEKIPNEYMMRSRVFFGSHTKEVDAVLKILYDDRSRTVYENMCHFRGTYDRRLNRDYSVFDQYFPKDIVIPEKKECFIDCGAYVGDSIDRFRRWGRKGGVQTLKTVGLEPDQQNYNKLERYIRNHFSAGTGKALNIGAWDRKDVLHFNPDGTVGTIENKGDLSVDVIDLDGIPECQDASFIKMDIEGAEQKALEGAKRIISCNHPKLAICIYHSDEDMIEIPLKLYEKYPFYKMYVRQHSPIYTETVLYCIP